MLSLSVWLWFVWGFFALLFFFSQVKDGGVYVTLTLVCLPFLDLQLTLAEGFCFYQLKCNTKEHDIMMQNLYAYSLMSLTASNALY